jgi:hypothetical protein
MNFQNYVWNIEESHKMFLKEAISKQQYATELNNINTRMKKSGFNETEVSEALVEGKRCAVDSMSLVK